jgi:hypothetical protein
MDQCDQCHRLSEGFKGIGIPAHLSRVATLRKDGKVTFRYECTACGENWDFCRGRGWHRDIDAPVSPALLARLVSAAKSRVTRLHF